MTLMHEELDLNQAVDVFWFYFGYSGLFTLHDENGWSYERAEHGSAVRPAGLCCEIIRRIKHAVRFQLSKERKTSSQLQALKTR